MAANIAYLRDLDYLAARTGAALGPRTPPPPPQAAAAAAAAAGEETAKGSPKGAGRSGGRARKLLSMSNIT